MSSFQNIQDMTGGQWAALVQKVGGPEAVKKILRGEARVELVDVILNFFDQHGRRIPHVPDKLKSKTCDPNKGFFWDKPDQIDFQSRLERLCHALELKQPPMSASEWEEKIWLVLERLLKNEQCRNILKAPRFPLLIPQMDLTRSDGKKGDYSKGLYKVILPAVERAHKSQFPVRSFGGNYHRVELAGVVKLVDRSRHGRLLNQLKQGPLAFPFFPGSLQGFSVHAQREQLAPLPDMFSLSGPLEFAFGLMIYPDILARDWYTPGMDCSAVQWRSSGCSLFFKADGDGLDFVSGGFLARPYDGYSGGLSVL